MTDALKSCPWCGQTPDVTNDAVFRLTDGVKYGAVQCCCIGPEVRTDYKDVSHWKADAIAAWNERAQVSDAERLTADASDQAPDEWRQAVYDACSVAFIDCGPASNPRKAIEALIQAHIDAADAARPAPVVEVPTAGAVGWKLVPIKATDDMERKGFYAVDGMRSTVEAELCWDAMVAAAPDRAPSTDSATERDAGALEIACLINKKLGDYIAGRTYLLPADMAALKRFNECATDFDSGGHDVSKAAMARLREIGVMQSIGFGRHQTTSFGDYVLERADGEAAKLPLRTLVERNAPPAAIAAMKGEA